ncbi:hypothetical protein [Wolbachia endosymbiont (group A) of Agelastica alni]|uniref:hypothetical protein n=1 Tax=Wolbachia endosymbiont (group A) of Agelastica alni TaxID=3066130 RepID=UPI00333F1FC7
MKEKKKHVVFCENNNKIHKFENNQDKFIGYFRSLPPEQALKELQDSLDDLGELNKFNKRDIKLRRGLIREIQNRIKQQNKSQQVEQISNNQKPQLWERSAAIMKEPRSMEREIKLQKDPIKQKNKPQLWKRGAAIIAPPAIGLLGGLAALVLITEGAFLIAALVAVATTVAIYGLEYLIKPQLLEKPSETLKGLVEAAKNFFAKEDKTQGLH